MIVVTIVNELYRPSYNWGDAHFVPSTWIVKEIVSSKIHGICVEYVGVEFTY